MEKKIFFTVIIFIISIFMCMSVYAKSDITLYINGEQIDSDVKPMIIDGSTMVPVRVLFDKLSANVLWNDSLRQVTVTSGQDVIIFNINSKIAYHNGSAKTLITAPVIRDGRTLVPIRFISENLGYNVDWDENLRRVSISSKVEDTKGDSTGNPSGGNTDKPQDNTSAPSASGISLNYISVSENEHGYNVLVSSSSKIKPKLMTLDDPYRLVFDFYASSINIKDAKTDYSSNPVKQIRWSKHDSYTRVVIECALKSNYTLTYPSEGQCCITVAKTGSGGSNSSSSGQSNVTPVTPNGRIPKVVIDAGHGGFDSGAVGKDSSGNAVLYEKTANLNIALSLEQKLKAYGIDVVMTRSTDKALGSTTMEDLVNRSLIANNNNADIFVSIHNDASDNTSATGTSVLYSGLANSGNYGISGKEIAANILTPLVKATGLANRGLSERPNLVVLKRTVMPAVLVECAFVTCEKDRAVLMNDAKVSKIADAICEGIITSLRTMKKIK